jgi:hypothetical protein
VVLILNRWALNTVLHGEVSPHLLEQCLEASPIQCYSPGLRAGARTTRINILQVTSMCAALHWLDCSRSKPGWGLHVIEQQGQQHWCQQLLFPTTCGRGYPLSRRLTGRHTSEEDTACTSGAPWNRIRKAQVQCQEGGR